MRAKLKNIGNSRGIILPPSIIKQYNLEDGIEITTKDDHIAISHPARARAGWNELFAKASPKHNDDASLIDDGLENQFDQDEWTW